MDDTENTNKMTVQVPGNVREKMRLTVETLMAKQMKLQSKRTEVCNFPENDKKNDRAYEDLPL